MRIWIQLGPGLRIRILEGQNCLKCATCCRVGDPDPQDPHVLGLLDPDPLIRGTDPAPDPYLFLINVESGLK
jgi:hypothetical protein